MEPRKLYGHPRIQVVGPDVVGVVGLLVSALPRSASPMHTCTDKYDECLLTSFGTESAGKGFVKPRLGDSVE
jgi:hypothetical protein